MGVRVREGLGEAGGHVCNMDVSKGGKGSGGCGFAEIADVPLENQLQSLTSFTVVYNERDGRKGGREGGGKRERERERERETVIHSDQTLNWKRTLQTNECGWGVAMEIIEYQISYN